MQMETRKMRQINKILIAAFLVILGWFLLDILLNLGKTEAPSFSGTDKDEEADVPVKKIGQPPPDFGYFSKEIGKRQLFKGSSIQQESVPGQEASNAAADITSPVFQLLGIVAGAKPQVIIQNNRTQKTYFLYKGQIQDNLKLEDVSGNKAKISYEGETFELFL
jgi:hypothetical protein